ncbi:hypothetical protein CSC94_10370 [Zhengella mangrovi]|uniref:Uncharacterized protein n=1 Tax=Zhengella mangrovi TaxID=1982044 RepID=A0A2G1QN52_9HYPH|nr:tetratricopeptide repeat protein [Zhengella mangrovi]PHP66955.1 hypothetical protein CSC94_10370 [Zhengella mangrovi]
MSGSILHQQMARFQRAVASENWAEALILATGLEKAVPDHAGIAYNKGLVLRRLGRHADAIRAFSHALDLDAGHAKALFERASCLLDLGDAAGAVQGFLAYLKMEPRDGDALLNLGNALVRLGRADEALDPLRNARERLGTARSIAALAVAQRETGDLDGCAETLENLGPGPDNAALRLKIMTQGARGRFPLRPGQPREARKALR